MSCMGVFFQFETVLAPDDTGLFATKADAFYRYFAAARPALLSVK